MDSIKASLNKMGGNNDSSSFQIPGAIPKRLSFDYLNVSYESARKKRKLSSETDPSPQADSSLNNTSNMSINSSFNSSATSSPWEARRMRADLIEAQSRIAMLKKEIEHQNMVRSSTELENSHKISSLEKQLAYNANKVSETDKHLALLRKRESTLREDLVKMRNQLNKQKQTLEEKIMYLERDNKELDENLQYTTSDLNAEIRDLSQQVIEMEEQLAMTQEELDTFKEINATLQNKADSYDACKKELDDVKEKLSEAESKIKSLEYEVGSYGDWKELSKVSHSRLSSCSDLEKEVARLRDESKKLHDTIGNKLLLEEQVADLKSRLERVTKDDDDSVNLKVKITAIEKELTDWKLVASEFLPKKSAVTPVVMRSHIQTILQNDLIMASEKSSSKSEKCQIEQEVEELRMANEKQQKELDDLKRLGNQYKSIMQRLQKKLQLVIMERDSLKDLVETYEKDLTISPSSGTTPTNNIENQLRMRSEMLEKSVKGYKELVKKMEDELNAAKALFPAEMATDYSPALSAEQYDRLRKEIDSLNNENEKLRKRKEELELQMENFTLRAEINRDRIKIVHYKENPAALAYEARKNQMEKMQAEVERLKLKIKKLEEGNSELTMRLNDSNMTVQIQEVNTLKKEIESLEAKNEKIKDIYKGASREFREVCYMLFGFRVDRVNNSNYKISSMYAESEEEYLNFILDDKGILSMLESQYSESLNELVRSHLGSHGSLPAFLSSLTLELFNKTTHMVQN